MAKKKLVAQNNDGETIVPIEGETALSTYKRSPHTKIGKQRPLSFIPFSVPLKKATGMPGFAISNCNFLMGFSNTGKTTAMLESMVQTQKDGNLCVICITEKKFSFPHLKEMGFQCELTKHVDEETGEEINVWDGFFIYKDDFECSDDIYSFMNTIIEDTKKGKLPHNVVFYIDSMNKLPCRMSLEKGFEGGGGTMHNARTHTELFGGILEPKITASKYIEKYPYTISLVAVLRGYSGSDNMGVIIARGGNVFKYDAGLTYLFGGKTAAAIQELTYTLNGDKVNIGVTTTVRVLKNHLTSGSKESKISAVLHGFIGSEKEDFDEYKKQNKKQIEEYFSNIDADQIIDKPDEE